MGLSFVFLVWSASASANSPPVIATLTATPAAVVPNGFVLLQATATDPDCAAPPCTTDCGTAVSSAFTLWSANGGTIVSANPGTTGSPYVTSATWQAPAAQGTYRVTLFLKDNGGFTCGGAQSTSSFLDIAVSTNPNLPPIFDSLSAASSSVFPGASTTLTAAAHDPEGQPLIFTWASTAGVVTALAGGTASFSAPPSPARVTITCTAHDPGGAVASATITVVTTDALAEKTIGAGLRSPSRVAVNRHGELFVLDPGLFGLAIGSLLDGTIAEVWPLADVNGVAIDWGERIVLGEGLAATVRLRTGELAGSLYPLEALGPVSDVAVDRAARRYGVLYGDSGRVLVFNESGQRLFAFGRSGDAAGQLRGARALAFLATGDLAVGDTGHGRVQVFSGVDGAFLRSVGGFGPRDGQLGQVLGVATRAGGPFIATDSFQAQLSSWNADGTFRENIGTYGTGLGQFRTPAGVAVSETFRRLVVASVNSSRLDVFRLSGTGAAGPVLAPSSTLLRILVPPGDVSATGQIVLRSVGDAPVDVSSLYVDGVGFTLLSSGCGSRLQPGASCVVQVGFTPPYTLVSSGRLFAASSAVNAPLEISLMGQALRVMSTVLEFPTSIAFGSVLLPRSSPPQALRMRNNGSTAVASGIAGTPSLPDFVVASDGCAGTTLEPGASCEMRLVFTPAVLGDRLASLEIRFPDGRPTATVSLSGTGVDAASAAVPIPTAGPLGLAVLVAALAVTGTLLLRRRLG